MSIGAILFLLQLLSPPEVDSTWMRKYDIIRPSGKAFIVKKYYYDTLNIMRVDKKWKAGIVNKNGKIILPLDYDDVGLFSEGLAEVVKRSTCSSCWDSGDCNSFYYEGDHGYANEKGTIVIPLKYSAVGEFHEGLAWVAVERADGDIVWAFINKSGKRVFNYTFKEARRFQGGVAAVTYEYNNKEYFNYINHSGELLIPAKYEFLENYRPQTMRAFRRRGLYGFLDSLGLEKVRPEYNFLDFTFKCNWQNMRMIGNHNKYGYINEKDGVMAIPIIYDSLFAADKNFLWANKARKWGLVNSRNEIIAPFQFTYVEPFYEKLACVSLNGKFGFIDTTGNFKIKPIFEEAHYFNEGLSIFRKGDKYGYINSTGKIVIPAKYNYLSVFKHNHAKIRWKFIYATIDRDDKWILWSLNYQAKLAILISVLLCITVYWYRMYKRNPLH